MTTAPTIATLPPMTTDHTQTLANLSSRVYDELLFFADSHTLLSLERFFNDVRASNSSTPAAFRSSGSRYLGSSATVSRWASISSAPAEVGVLIIESKPSSRASLRERFATHGYRSNVSTTEALPFVGDHTVELMRRWTDLSSPTNTKERSSRSSSTNPIR